MPPWPCFKVLPLSRSTATNSFRLCAGELRAMMTAGEWAVMPIGVKAGNGIVLEVRREHRGGHMGAHGGGEQGVVLGRGGGGAGSGHVLSAPATFSITIDCLRNLAIWSSYARNHVAGPCRRETERSP